MKPTSCFFVLAALLASGATASDDYSIKGYRIGQPMESCPDGSSTDGSRVVMCQIDTNTYAGAKVRAASIAVFEKEVIGVMISLVDRGQHANSGVLAALTTKLGSPDGRTSQPRLNSYSWKNGTQFFSFDGWKGIVLLTDTAKHERAVKLSAEINKNDL